GGVTGAGFSPGIDGGGTETFDVFIEPGSTIRQAYLLAGRHGNASDLEVELNDIALEFNDDNLVSEEFTSLYGGASGVHAIDVTDLIDATWVDYELTGTLAGINDRYADFYLYIAYDNLSLDTVHSILMVNDQDFADLVEYDFELTAPLDTACNDIVLSLLTGYACFTGADGENVYADGSYLGQYGGPDENSGDCGGPMGNFAYADHICTGLSDDTPDAFIDGPDVLAVINSYITPGSTTVSIDCEHEPGGSPTDNAIWAIMLTYGSAGLVPIGTITASNDTLICKGDTIQLNSDAESGTIYWNPPAGLSDPTIASPIAFPETTTTYIVSVTAGCSAAYDTVTIFVDEYVPAEINNAEVCFNETLEIGNDTEPGVIYNWQPDLYVNDNTISNPIFTPGENTEYTVTITNELGCVFYDTMQVDVVGEQVFASNDTVIAIGNTIQIFATGTGDYLWQPQDSIDCPTCPDPFVTPLNSTLYVVSFTDETGCKSEADVFVQVLTACEQFIFIPNAFSPNNDLINDKFSIISITPEVIGLLTIYNRWGEIIFESPDILNGWDGKYKGADLPMDSYTYLLLLNCEQDEKWFAGSFILVR
ncbi:MAG: gliding motility-associated C-terminal domain-containing protein, partial [Chitinophagales bacterium]|nr:gliding motility-associated C-terminal domain-containing protein [Chitinophagales bacterium]